MYRFISLPEYLIIVLKRFKKNIENNILSFSKNTNLITFPFILDMNRYTYGYINHTNNIYNLQSVTYHTGNINSGHYYSLLCLLLV